MNNESMNIKSPARRLFACCAVVDAAAFLSAFFFRRTGMIIACTPHTVWLIGLVTLFFVTIVSMILPIVLRMMFMARSVKLKTFDVNGYRHLLLWTIRGPMIGALAASVAYYFSVPKLHLLTVMLFALYGVYSAIPASKKIDGEIRYFRHRFP